MENTKSCIACAEKIHIDAKLCKHCKVEQTDIRFAGSSKIKKSSVADVDSANTDKEASQSHSKGLTLKVLGGLGVVILLMVVVSMLMGTSSSQGGGSSPEGVAARIAGCGSLNFTKAGVVIRNETSETQNVEVLVAWYSQDGTQVQTAIASETVGPNSEAIAGTVVPAKYFETTCEILEVRTF